MMDKQELTDELINKTVTAIDNDDLTTEEIIDSMAVYIVRRVDITFSAATSMAKHIINAAEDIKHE